MIRAWLLRDGIEGHEDLPLDALDEAIGPKQGLVWVDCVEATPQELDSLTAELQISHLAAGDLRQGGQRTKLEH